jgi:outer membrane protein TolC
VEDNRSLLAHLGEEERAASAGTGAARQTADAALDLYREGATSYLDVVTAQTALLQNRQALLDVRTRSLWRRSISFARWAVAGGRRCKERRPFDL